MSNQHPEIKWLSEPEEKDYPAAASYLSLLYNKTSVKTFVKKLRKAKVTQFKAKDVFRASGLSLLGVSNSHIEKDRKKIKDSEELSPLLLVRDENSGRVIIADGYHRMCAVYSFSEDAFIPCKIV
jgi:disulfide oxidoreductase YuzD